MSHVHFLDLFIIACTQLLINCFIYKINFQVLFLLKEKNFSVSSQSLSTVYRKDFWAFMLLVLDKLVEIFLPFIIFQWSIMS